MSKFIKVVFDSARLTVTENFTKKRVDSFNEKSGLNPDYSGVDTVYNQLLRTNEKRSANQIISNVPDCNNPFGTTENLIHLEQVSNMLHVLIGERPVSTFHTPVIDGTPIRRRSEVIDEIVKNGYVRLTNIYNTKGKDEKEYIISETVKHRKGGYSNKKGAGIITWRKFHLYFFDTPEREYEIRRLINEFTNKPFDEEHYSNVSEAVREVERSERKEEFENALGKNKIGKILGSSFLNLKGGHIYSMMSSGSFVSKEICLNGEFVFEVPDNIYDRIVKGTKCATYLDGGIAVLTKWEGSNTYFSRKYEYDMILYLENNGYNKISDIDIR